MLTRAGSSFRFQGVRVEIHLNNVAKLDRLPISDSHVVGGIRALKMLDTIIISFFTLQFSIRVLLMQTSS